MRVLILTTTGILLMWAFYATANTSEAMNVCMSKGFSFDYCHYKLNR